MGEVFRARDPRRKCDVALKVLPESVARDAARLARFEREAQVLASLNHPHIAAIYGVEESDHGLALVMELVVGGVSSSYGNAIGAAGFIFESLDTRSDVWKLTPPASRH